MAAHQSTTADRVYNRWNARDAEEHYQTLLQAAPKPQVLDDYTVGRVFEVFGRQKDDLWLFEEQLARWKRDKLSVGQRDEVDRLTEQVSRMPDRHRLDPFAHGTIKTGDDRW